jgi:uncharacterized membrane protein YeaQ/YmgE (transglycosylase-associated protein family)
MSILAFLVFGFIVGLIARAIMPGRQTMGLVGTTLLGIAGSFVGGLIGSVIHGGGAMELHTTGIIGSILGALLVMALVGFGAHHRATV